MSSDKQATLDGYKQDLLSGRVFALHAASARSSYGYRPPIGRTQWATCMERLARMAAQSDRLAQVANMILGRVNLYGTAPQAEAAVYERAGEALAKGFDDVIGRAGPEAGRHSDHQHEFSLADRVAVAYWLEYATRPFSSCVPGVGWCLSNIAQEINYYAPREMQVERAA